VLRIEDLGQKAGSQKAKTPARWLALSGSGTILLPKKYCTLGLSFCQLKTVKIAGAAAAKGRGEGTVVRCQFFGCQ